MKILFVDDDEDILEAARTALQVYGYDVITATSGKECLEKIGEADVVFLDIKMPGMDGIETLKEIKKVRPELPVIMITAYATVDNAIQAMKEGASDYIRKPFKIEELEGSILATIEDIKFREYEKIYVGSDAIDSFKKSSKRMHIGREREMDAIFIPMEQDMKARNIEEIMNDIENNIERDMHIFISDIDYIYRNYGEKTREFLEWVNKKAASNNCKLLISAKIVNLDEKEKKELQEIITDVHLGILTDSISNYIRRKVINLLSDGKKYSFTKIAQEIGIDENPKLSFHLKKLKDDGVIEQDEEKRYYLTTMGKEIAKFIEEMRKKKLNKDVVWREWIK